MKRRSLLALAALSACNRFGASAGGEVPLLEWRNADAQPAFAIYRAEGGYRWVDGVSGTEGWVKSQGNRLEGVDPKRGALTIEPAAGETGGWDVRGSGGVLLKVRTVDGLLRLGDGAGIPMARVRQEGEQVIAHDAGGVVSARVRRSGGRVVVSSREGAVTGFVTSDVALERIALAAAPALGPGERALLLLAP